jgi:hypothetical protein
MAPRLAALFLCALVAAPVATAAPAAPQNVRAFLLASDETPAAGRTYARTPSFAWNKVAGATRYEFELATSTRFSENSLVWESNTLTAPLTTIPITLPWTTGSPYSFYARIRARTATGTTAWSAPYGFRMRSPAAPVSLSSGANATPGMVRWTPVEGATAYQVTYLYDLAAGEKKLFKTATTAADLREYYTLHNQYFTDVGDVLWRVRAVREVMGKTSNRIPAVSYGPWSAYVTTSDPPIANGIIDPLGAVSRSRASDISSGIPGPGASPHELFPGFWWDGDRSLEGFGACPPAVALTGVTCPLYHVYVFTDEDCVNRVHVSDLVGSPAYVPRLTPPLALPAAPDKLAATAGYIALGDGEEGSVFDAGGDELFAAGMDPLLPPQPDPEIPGKTPDRRSGIWDNDWPNGHYYWTAVPAVPRITLDQKVEYHDVGFAEDMCAAGRFGTFGKESAPVVEKASGAPYASGMTLSGLVRSATTSTPSFFGRIVVAWRPAPGAREYQVQWSRTANPFTAAGSTRTSATSTLLNLPTGVWYYRVRGIDKSIPGTLQGMTWSDPQYVRMVPRTFVVVG